MVIDSVVHRFPDEGKQLKPFGIDALLAHIIHRLGENFREAQLVDVQIGNGLCGLGSFIQVQKLACIIFNTPFLSVPRAAA